MYIHRETKGGIVGGSTSEDGPPYQSGSMSQIPYRQHYWKKQSPVVLAQRGVFKLKPTTKVLSPTTDWNTFATFAVSLIYFVIISIASQTFSFSLINRRRSEYNLTRLTYCQDFCVLILPSRFIQPFSFSLY